MATKLIVSAICVAGLCFSQKPSTTDILNGQKTAADAAAHNADVAARAARTSAANSASRATNEAVEHYKQSRDLQDMLDGLAAQVRSLQDSRKRADDEAYAAHADTMRQMKVFGFSTLGVFISAGIAFIVKHYSDRDRHLLADRKLDTITVMVDGKMTAAMKTTVATLRGELALLRRLAPDDAEAIAHVESEIRDRDEELFDRAETMDRASRVKEGSA
jgi:hypothetical protein